MTGLAGWHIRRHRPEGITPLEVYNLPVLGHELWELLGAPRLEEDARAGVPEDELAPRLVPTLVAALDLLSHQHHMDAVYLCGGLAALEGFTPALAEAVEALPCPVFVAREPRFASVYAGLRLLEDLRPVLPLSVDVGQTSIKCASDTDRDVDVFERDLAEAPRLFIGKPRPPDGSHISAAARFISRALRTTARQLPQPLDALCLALPCPLDDALVPGGCTYGWEGHAPLVTDILHAARLPERGGTVRVLNDAELAAEAARHDPRISGDRVLCLTLGLGPGGALLER